MQGVRCQYINMLPSVVFTVQKNLYQVPLSPPLLSQQWPGAGGLRLPQHWILLGRACNHFDTYHWMILKGHLGLDTVMWHECILDVSYMQFFFPDLMFWEFLIWSLSFFKYRSRNDSNEECIILEDIQHLQPHMTLYCADILFCWGRNSESNV